MGRHFKSALIGGLVGVAALFAVSGYAAEFPARPLRLVVPYAAGGPTDVVGRVVADFLARDLKQAAFVENKPGAQGAIGSEAVARSDADGYTLPGRVRLDVRAQSHALQEAGLRSRSGFSAPWRSSRRTLW